MKRSGSGRVARKIGAYEDSSADSSQNEAQDAPGTFMSCASQLASKHLFLTSPLQAIRANSRRRNCCAETNLWKEQEALVAAGVFWTGRLGRE